MKITDIKPQVKTPGRYSVFVDGVFSFGLSESGLLASGLYAGMEMTEQSLATLKERSRADKGYMRALDLISRRLRSEWEIRDYLRRKEYDVPVIDDIMKRLQGRGYLNDEVFARMWVENRRLLKPTSRRKLIMELRQKRIAADVIDMVLASGVEQDQERLALRELIAKKRQRYPDRMKLMQYLARQGFGYDDIKTELDQQD